MSSAVAERIEAAEEQLTQVEQKLADADTRRLKEDRRSVLAKLSTLHQDAERARLDATSDLNIAAVEMRKAIGDVNTTAPPFMQAVEKARVIRRVYESALARARKLEVEISPEQTVPRVALSARPSHHSLGVRLRILLQQGIDF